MNKPFLSRWLIFFLAFCLTLPAIASQTLQLSAGQTAANSSNVVVPNSGILAMFPSSGSLPPVTLVVQFLSNGVWIPVGTLTNAQPTYIMLQPGTYRVVRPDISRYGVSVGVTSDLLDGSGPVGSVTITGTLPAFAATPTFNLGTISTAATAANQTSGNTSLSTIATNTTGVSTAAKQPGFGTAGTANANVVTVQGIASMTPLLTTDTQSGTWTVQPGNTANTTPWLVTGAGQTFPVTGIFWQATQPVSLATAPALVAGSAIIGKVGIDQTTPGTTNAVSSTNLPSTVSTGSGATGASSPRVTVAVDSATVAGSASLPAGTNLIGKMGIDQTTPGTTNAVFDTNWPTTVSTGTGAQGASSPRVTIATDSATVAGSASLPAGTNAIGSVTLSAASSGGLSAYSANVTNSAVAVDASAGQIGWYMIGNQNGAVCYLQVFNLAAASVSLGSTTPTYSLPIPAFGGANATVTSGLAFGTAISVAATTTRTGSTACTSGLDVNIGYK